MSETLQIPTHALADFCSRWRVRELALFGSAVRPDFQPHSDVDVLIRFDAEAPWSLWDLVTMRDELTEIFGRDVDLLEEDALRNPFMRSSVLRDKRVIYAA